MAGHSNYGFSGQSRIIACPGSVSMQDGLPNEGNPQSELGTAVHELSEFALRLGVTCHDLIGMTFNKHKVTEDMSYAGQMYVEYVNQLRAKYPKATFIIEGKVCLSSIDAERLWGTSDCIMVDIDSRTIIVGDYKNGYGIVEVDGTQQTYGGDDVTGNAQCVGYLIAAMDTHGLWGKIDNFITFVCQPNVEHINGYIRVKTYTKDELKVWWGVYAHAHAMAISDVPPRKAGKHCKYCRAKGHCPTRIDYMLQLLKIDQSISSCTPEQLIAIYNETDVILYTLQAVEKHITALARQGVKIPGRKLVKGIVRANCTDETSLVNDVVNKGIDKSKLYHEPKLKGKTEIVKVAGKDIANKYFVTPEAGLTLVNLNDKRPAVMADQKPSAAGKFGAI